MICEKCGKFFPTRILIDGKKHNLQNRKYCLDCSPFGNHNTKKITEPMYRCSQCGDENPENFPVGRYTECKKCRNRYNKKALKNNKRRGIDYLGGKCACCGFDKGLSAFDFHHINPNHKDANFPRHLYWSWDRLKTELDLCLLMCSNCHRLLHNGEISYSEFKYIPDEKLPLIQSCNVGA